MCYSITTMRWAIAVFLLFASIHVVSGQGQSSPANRDEAHAKETKKPEPKPTTSSDSVVVIQQETATAQDNGAKNASKGYLARLIAPENLPNIVLCFVGIGGIIIALCTLKVIERQTRHIARQAQSMRYQTTHLKNSVTQATIAANAAKDSADALINSERAWVIVHAELAHDMGKFFIRPKVMNLGKTIARIRKISVGGSAIQVGKPLPDIPVYQTSADYDFILCPEQGFPEEEIPRIPVDGENIPSFNQGVLKLYAYILVEYLDLAERKRETGFVLIYRPMKFLPYLNAPPAYYKAT